MKTVKKAVALLLLLSIALIWLISCEGKPDNNQALDISNSLIEKAYILNIAVYGQGLEYDDDGNPSTLYANVSINAPYQTRGDMEREINETFSSNFASAMTEIAFSGQEGIISSTINHARYTSYSDEGFLKVYKNIKGIEVRKPDIALTSITKIKRKEIRGIITFENGQTEEFYAVKEKSGWRLDSPTY